jgi:hypothetical protein
MQHLFLELEHGQGFEGVISFMAPSVAVAKKTLFDAITVAKQVQDTYDTEVKRRGAYLRELQASMRHYALDEIPADLEKQIAAEMQNTDLRKFPRPSDEFQFYGRTLTLGEFCHDHDGYINHEFNPNIVTVEELCNMQTR